MEQEKVNHHKVTPISNEGKNNSIDSSSVVKFTQETSFAGLKYVGNAHNHTIRRLFWFLLILLALSGLGFQIVKTTSKFIQRPSSTKLSYDENETLIFPSVTFCNSNMFRFDLVEKAYGGYYELYMVGLNQLKLLFHSIGLVDIDPRVRVKDDQLPGNTSLYSFIVDNAHLKEDAIKSCLFNGKSCGPENFTTVVTNYGVCYTFNSIATGPPLTVKRTGQSRGLSVLLDAEPHLHVSAPRENSGFKVLLHSQDDVINPLDFGIELDLGKHTSLRILPREVTRLEYPYGKCVPQNKGKLEYLNGSYTKGKCLLECETRFIVEACQCRAFYMPGNSTYCNLGQLVDCVYPAYDRLNETNSEHCQCPDICQETKYRSSISQSTFPSGTIPIHLNYIGVIDHEKRAFKHRLMWDSTFLLTEIWFEMNKLASGWFLNLNDSAGTNIKDTYPSEYGCIFYDYLNRAFYDMTFGIPFLITEHTYNELYSYVGLDFGVLNTSFGSDIYVKYRDEVNHSFIQTGKYKTHLANGLANCVYNPSLNISLDELVDNVYNEYKIASGFDVIFPWTYKAIHEMFIDNGLRILRENGINQLTTTFMRTNYGRVDIYFGDLEVESIIDQREYEIFQFICDWGGALGLFFGASLMSFIEAVDFFASEFWKKSKKTETT